MLRLYLAWRLFRLLRHAIVVGALLALLAAAASGRLSQIARRVLGPEVTSIQKGVQHAVQHALRPGDAQAP
jgi:hypothetical protein